MMKLTRKQALLACKEIWQQRANNPELDYYLSTKKYRNNCPACEYNKTHKQHYCGTTCILSNTWPYGCMSTVRNPFEKWKIGRQHKNFKLCTLAALKIVKGCNEALELLANKK